MVCHEWNRVSTYLMHTYIAFYISKLVYFHFSLQKYSTAAYDKYLRTFLQDFYVSVIKLIDKSMRNVDTSVRGLMAAEIHKHMHICNESAKKFLGREFQLYKVIILLFF